jgi:hypothetical protein
VAVRLALTERARSPRAVGRRHGAPRGVPPRRGAARAGGHRPLCRGAHALLALRLPRRDPAKPCAPRAR